MKTTINIAITVSLLFFACSLPKTQKTELMMEKFWQFYKSENYDSLVSFYIPKGDNPQQRIKDLFEALHKLHENYGSVSEIQLVEKFSSISINNAERIELTYEVTHEKKTLTHFFSFKKTNNDTFKIIDHSFNQ